MAAAAVSNHVSHGASFSHMQQQPGCPSSGAGHVISGGYLAKHQRAQQLGARSAFMHPAPQGPSRTRPRRGCNRCIACSGLARHAHCMASTTAESGCEEFNEWWPTGIQSPTIYFLLRYRQLDYSIRQQAARQSKGVWREAGESHAEGDSALRRQRGLGGLAVSLPCSFTNISQADATVRFVKVVNVRLARRPPSPPLGASPARCASPAALGPSPFSPRVLPPAATTPALAPLHATSTPPPQEPRPLVKAALAAAAALSAARAQQEPQQAQHGATAAAQCLLSSASSGSGSGSSSGNGGRMHGPVARSEPMAIEAPRAAHTAAPLGAAGAPPAAGRAGQGSPDGNWAEPKRSRTAASGGGSLLRTLRHAGHGQHGAWEQQAAPAARCAAREAPAHPVQQLLPRQASFRAPMPAPEGSPAHLAPNPAAYPRPFHHYQQQQQQHASGGAAGPFAAPALQLQDLYGSQGQQQHYPNQHYPSQQLFAQQQQQQQCPSQLQLSGAQLGCQGSYGVAASEGSAMSLWGGSETSRSGGSVCSMASLAAFGSGSLPSVPSVPSMQGGQCSAMQLDSGAHSASSSASSLAPFTSAPALPAAPASSSVPCMHLPTPPHAALPPNPGSFSSAGSASLNASFGGSGSGGSSSMPLVIAIQTAPVSQSTAAGAGGMAGAAAARQGPAAGPLQQHAWAGFTSSVGEEERASYYRRQFAIKSELAFACHEVVDLAPAGQQQQQHAQQGGGEEGAAWAGLLMRPLRSLAAGITQVGRKVSPTRAD